MFTSCLVVHTLVSDYSYSTGSDGVSFGGKHPVQLQCKLLLACLQSFPVRPEMCHLNFSVFAILFLSLTPSSPYRQIILYDLSHFFFQ